MSRKNPVRVTFQKSLDQSKCMIYTQANYICTQANYIYASELVRRALSSTTFSDHICHWLIELLMDFLSVYPMHLILLLKAFQCAHIALHSCRPSFQSINWIEVTRIRMSIFLSVIIRDIFIEVIGNRICCVAASPILLNSELSPPDNLLIT